MKRMSERPILEENMKGNDFRNFYYLKEELENFCRANGLPASGSKIELTDRIACYLDTGEILSTKSLHKNKTNMGVITEHTIIEPNFVCSEKHRAFFREEIGNSFSFNVTFQKWLKDNTGKTYAQAIERYYQIIAEKKKGTSVIDQQFEYNTYIRAFFEDNSGKTLKQAIICWKYKKALPGHNRYENSDLIALNFVNELPVKVNKRSFLM